MEDEDGTCLLDVLCDPQALNDFLHGTNELQTEDLLISSSSGEPSLFTDAPSPVSLLGDGSGSPGTPPPGCVDLSFLEEALLSSPEGADEDPRPGRGGPPAGAAFRPKKGEAEGAGEACDILQQSLQEAEITEQTMALEAGPAPSPPAAPFAPKSVILPIAQALPRDTQAAVEPPQPSLLAVGPGCPSLKPTAPPRLMGLLPGNVFPAASPETSFSLSPAQAASSVIIHKAPPGVTGRPFLASALRAAGAAGLVLQRGPLHIQPKLPVSIQPRLVQISPKPSGGQKHAPGLTFLPGTNPPNILLSQPQGQKPAAPAAPAPPPQQLPKPLSLQLVNQGGSFVLQPQGLFQGQSQFLLPSQPPVAIPQTACAARPLLTPARRGVNPPGGSQILAVPQRRLNFSPVFATASGQLALRQATVLSGPLQLQPAPPAVFQVPAQLAGAYAPAGQGQRTALVHGPALGNHITLINSSGVLPPDLTSISIVNGPSVVQGVPFAAQAPPPRAGVASVVLLQESAVQEERAASEETLQPYGRVLQHVSVQSSSPPVVAVPEAPPDPPLAPDPAVEIPKLLMPPAEMTPVVEEASQNDAFMQHLQQQALSPPLTSDLSVGSLPAVPMEPLASPVAPGQDARPVASDQCAESSPLRPGPVDPLPTRSSPPVAEAPPAPPPGPEGSVAAPRTGLEPPLQYRAPHHLLNRVQTEPSSAHGSPPPPRVPAPQQQPDPAAARPPPPGGGAPAVQQHTQNKPTAALVVESKELTLDVRPPSLEAPGARGHGHPAPTQTSQNKLADDALEEQEEQEEQEEREEQEEQEEKEEREEQKEQEEQEEREEQEEQEEQEEREEQEEQEEKEEREEQKEQEEQEERLTPAARRHRFQQQICLDHAAVRAPSTGPAFPALKDAVRRLLPYHACAGPPPAQEDFDLVDQQFDTVSGFLLKRTKDMVNKYRQLLVREAQQESPSAEMVMLERLFLQAERCALAEDRRRVRRDPEAFLTDLAASASPPPGARSSQRCSSGSPSPPPAWTRLSDRPPGLKTYRSSSRGALRLTIKQESGSRKVVRNSACEPGLKRDHAGRLTNGGGAADRRPPRAANGAPEGGCNRAPPGDPAGEVPHSAPCSRTKAPAPLLARGQQVAEVSGPKLKCCRSDESPGFSPPPPPLQEDSMLSEHLQSAIDSILELQRLQGPSAAPGRGAPGPPLDQAVTSILEGHL